MGVLLVTATISTVLFLSLQYILAHIYYFIKTFVILTGSLLITREEEEEEAKPEEVDERRQTFPMSKNNNNEKRNESHDSRQLILFCIGVGGSAVVAIVAFMAFKFARMMPAGSFEKQLKIVSEKANRKLCARRSEFMSLGQFDYYHNDDDEERSG